MKLADNEEEESRELGDRLDTKGRGKRGTQGVRGLVRRWTVTSVTSMNMRGI